MLTCAHNLYDRESKKKGSDLTFTPAANGEVGRSYAVKKCYYPPEFETLPEKDKSEYDIGVVELEEDLSGRYGYLGIDASEENLEGVDEVEVCGYPSDKKPKHTMWTAAGKLRGHNKKFLLHKIPTEEGQSGSPLIKEAKGRKYILGMHIGSDAKIERNIAVRLTPERRRMINQWVGEITGRLNLCKNEFIQLGRDWEMGR